MTTRVSRLHLISSVKGTTAAYFTSTSWFHANAAANHRSRLLLPTRPDGAERLLIQWAPIVVLLIRVHCLRVELRRETSSSLASGERTSASRRDSREVAYAKRERSTALTLFLFHVAPSYYYYYYLAACDWTWRAA